MTRVTESVPGTKHPTRPRPVSPMIMSNGGLVGSAPLLMIMETSRAGQAGQAGGRRYALRGAAKR